MSIIRGEVALMNLSLNKTVETYPRQFVIDSPTPLTSLHRLSEYCDVDYWPLSNGQIRRPLKCSIAKSLKKSDI